MKRALSWLGDRTGLARPLRWFFFEAIPGGPRWRYSWVTLVAFLFAVQAVTGFFLLTHYSPSMQTAWESVHYLQEQTRWGRWLRGMHALAAQAFVIALLLHLAQMILHRLYRAPREMVFLLLLAMLGLSLKMSVTGWVLPFDQKGYWAARVPLNLIGLVPVIGPWLQRLVLGGAEFSHLSLTRMAAFHTVVFPALMAVLMTAYFVLTHRLRSSLPREESEGDRPYWPYQAWRDASVCLLVMAGILAGVAAPLLRGEPPGVALMAPADPSELYPAARPEWFMLWLFQLLKFFPGGSEFIGAILIPGLLFLLVALMPWTGRSKAGAAFNTALVCVAGLGAVALGSWAAWTDRHDPAHQAALQRARVEAERARELASSPAGIPPAGALTMVRRDPWLMGPRLFSQHCASCHRYEGHNGLGEVPADPPSAADLAGFASREWLRGLLDAERITSPHYFGGTAHVDGKMVRFVRRDLARLDEEDRAKLPAAVAALSAEAALPAQREIDARDQALIEQGRKSIRGEPFYCVDCHQFRQPDEDATAPDLTGYGSRRWLLAFLANPAHPRFYGKRNDRMPAYGEEGVLTATELGLLADWLRADWWRPDAQPRTTSR